jgi:hypothetical protein
MPSIKIPTKTSAVTAKNIEKATGFLEDATAKTSATQIKGAIAFLEKAKAARTGSLKVLTPFINRAIAQGEKLLAKQALDKLEEKTRPDKTFRNLTMPTTVAADTKEEFTAGRTIMQIKRRDGQNFV